MKPLHTLTLLASMSIASLSAASEADWATVSTLLDASSATYTKTWDDANCRTLQQGAYLGNGDFGAHLGGTIHSLKYYLGKNGFHAGNDVAAGLYTQHILNLALLTVERSSGTESGDAYSVTQDLRNAEIRIHCTMAGYPVQTKAYLSASSNSLVLELSTNGGADVPLQATLSVIGNAYVAKSAGTVGSVAWVTKEPNADAAPFYVKGAVAAKVLGATTVETTDNSTYSRLAFTLPASGSTVKLFLQAEHEKNAASPLSSVQATARDISDASVAEIYARNQAWWKEYWLQSYINLGDDVQKYWYNHLYMIGSCARSGSDNAPGKAPGHWGPWNRADDMMWFSNLGMNYNAQNPYYGTFSANHVSLVDPYIQTIKYYAEKTARMRVVNRWVSPQIAARMPANCRGVEFEGSFTSHGTPSARGGSCGEEDCCMTTNAVFGILPIVWKWKYGQDRAFLADTCYPLMREVADFFDDYIGKPIDGRYDVYGSVHEGADWFARDDMFSLGAIRFLYREIIAASMEIGRDTDRRPHWQDILDNMSKYQLQAWEKSVTFRPDATHDVMEALTFGGGARNTGLMFTTTFDNISYSTLPAYKIATCKTLDKGNMFSPQRFSGWQESNDFGMMFVMAVRAGYPADRVIKAIKGWKPELNGIVSQKAGGGIETAGIIEAINNMLLQNAVLTCQTKCTTIQAIRKTKPYAPPHRIRVVPKACQNRHWHDHGRVSRSMEMDQRNPAGAGKNAAAAGLAAARGRHARAPRLATQDGGGPACRPRRVRAIREEIGVAGKGGGPPPASNESYGTAEAPLIQTNGDAACDLLYTSNFAFVGLHEAATATSCHREAARAPCGGR